MLYAAASVLAQAMAYYRLHSIDFIHVPRPLLGLPAQKVDSLTCFCRSRGYFTCELHCLSDSAGHLLDFFFTAGETPYCTQFETLSALAEARPPYLIADEGYHSDAIRYSLHDADIRSLIPLRSNRLSPIRWNIPLYLQRKLIERMVVYLTINRAIATRFDKLARSFLEILHLAALRSSLRSYITQLFHQDLVLFGEGWTLLSRWICSILPRHRQRPALH